MTDKQYWGNVCERHKNVAAWVAHVKVDSEGLHCFGCFIEAREKVAEERGKRTVSTKLLDMVKSLQHLGCSADPKTGEMWHRPICEQAQKLLDEITGGQKQ